MDTGDKFEQEFLAKVKDENVPVEAVGGGVSGAASAGEKKRVDKRWFVIGGLVVLLVGLLVTLNIIDSSSGSGTAGKDEDESSEEEITEEELYGTGEIDVSGLEPFTDKLSGYWPCSRSVSFEFFEDGTYEMMDVFGDAYIEEGSFSQRGNELSVKIKSSYMYETDESLEFESGETKYKLYNDREKSGSVLFVEGGMTIYNCQELGLEEGDNDEW